MFCARHFFVSISLDVTISASYNCSVSVFTTSLESQESYLTLGNVTLQTRLSITRDFFRQHSTFARLYNAAASPASRLRSAGSLAISERKMLSNIKQKNSIDRSYLFPQSLASTKYEYKRINNYFLPARCLPSGMSSKST